MTFQLYDTLLPKGTLGSNETRREEGPIIQQVVYNETSQDLFLQWKTRPNITKYNIQISTCGNSLLMNTRVDSPCSVSQLSGVNFTEYGFLLVAVQSCVTNDVCGLHPGLREKNIFALNFYNTGKELLGNKLYWFPLHVGEFRVKTEWLIYWEMDELEIQCKDWGLELNSQMIESQQSMQWTDSIVRTHCCIII